MNDAWKRIVRMIRRSDVVLELADARFCRFSTKVEKLCKRLGKKHLRIITKVDLISRKETEEKALRYRAVPFSARFRHTKRAILKYLTELKASMGKEVWVTVVGHQNAGKSTFINVLAGRKKARVSPRAGFTRGEQWIRIAPGIMLVDTPGTVPVKASEEDLAVEGIINPEDIKDPIKAVLRLKERFPLVFGGRDAIGFLEEIAKKRGLLLKGGELNLEEAARWVLRKWQRGEKLKL